MSNQPIPAKTNAGKKRGKSIFRTINDWLHLWLGLVSGLIVFIISITGCIWCFQKEISSLTQPYQFVKTEDKPYLSPSTLKKIAEQKQFGDKAEKPVRLLMEFSTPAQARRPLPLIAIRKRVS